MKSPGSPGSAAFLSWAGDLVEEGNVQRDALAVMYESCVPQGHWAGLRIWAR